MVKYIIRRVVMQIIVLFGVLIITFLVSHVVPGDPASLIAGPRATPAIIASLKHQWGLDKPIWVQFGLYLKELSHGKLGTSIFTHRPVAQDIRDFFPATFELTTYALLVVLIIGIPLGVLSAVHKDHIFDHISRIFSISGVSIPVFWLALMLLLLLYVKLGVVPGGGRLDSGIIPPFHITGLYTIDSLLTGNTKAFISSIRHLLLPVLTLSYVSVAVVTRMLRSSMLEVLDQDYIRTARAKGASERIVLWKHALRNALIPVITVAGLTYGSLLQGAVVTETIFAWPGMAHYAVTSMTSLDFPAVMGVTLVTATIYTTLNLMIDLSYSVIDPRIRYE